MMHYLVEPEAGKRTDDVVDTKKNGKIDIKII